MRVDVDRVGDRMSLVVLFVVLGASLSLNIMLGWKLTAGPSLRIAGIRPGAVVPRFTARTAEEDVVVTVDLSDQPATVLYVLSPKCAWCARDYDNIVALAAAASGRFRFIGISVTADGLKEHLQERPLPFDVVFLDSPGTIDGLDLSVTPQTALVGPDNMVERVWIGAFDGKKQEEIENEFNVRLPGVTAAPGAVGE